MTPRITRREARAFATRWKVVADAEREELLATSIEQKFTDLAALVESARALGWETTDLSEVEDVRARWRRLAAIYRG